MSTSVTIANSTYTVPALADSNWGTNVSNLLIALSSPTKLLQTNTTTFTLLSGDVDFGATYGLKASSFKSRNSNPSSAGIFRLANAESIGWRNAANGADLLLKVNASNQLEYNGLVLSGATALTGARALQSNEVTGAVEVSSVTATELGYLSGVTSAVQTQMNLKAPTATPTFTTSITTPLVIGGTDTTSSLTYKTTSGVGTTNADHIFLVGNNGATTAMRILNSGLVGIGRTPTTYKLEVNTSISVDGTAGTSINMRGGTGINYLYYDDRFQIAKNGAGSALAIDASRNITITGNILNSALTASRAVATDGSKNLVSSATTATELGYLNGVTSALQTQLDAKAPIATPTFTTNITSPLVIGGTGTTSTLTLKTTTGVGTTNADMRFQVGNNGATEAMRILNSGFVGINKTAPEFALHVNGGTSTAASLERTSTSTTVASAADVYNPDTTTNNWAALAFRGMDSGAVARNFALIGCQMVSHTATAIKGDIALFTGAATSTNTERLRCTSEGNVIFGSQAVLATTATNGFAHIPQTTGTPTGVPTLYTGKSPMVFDTGANKLWIYNGSWKSVTLA